MKGLAPDVWLIMTATFLRNFGFGLISVTLGLTLAARGFSAAAIGGLFALALLSGGAQSALFGLGANRFGRRRLLLLQAVAIMVGGALLAWSLSPWVIGLAALLASFSPTGKDIGGMLPLEQAGLARVVTADRRTFIYANYNLIAAVGTALGALAAGVFSGHGAGGSFSPFAWRFALILYGLLGLALAVLYGRLTPAVEGGGQTAKAPPLGPSRTIVTRLTALFGVDALAGGLVVQGIVVVLLHNRFGVGLGVLGPLFFLSNLAAAGSYLAAAPLAKRFGLLPTMVFTHLPSNVLLLLVAFAPTFPVAAALWVARSLLSQLDVPTRQAYTMAMVQPDEQAAAAGLTASVRGVSSAVSPSLSGLAMAQGLFGLPFIAAGTLKALYDLALYAIFRGVPLPSERAEASSRVT
ncbi:MAG: MFS transporter [Sulfobacillus sp.]